MSFRRVYEIHPRREDPAPALGCRARRAVRGVPAVALIGARQTDRRLSVEQRVSGDRRYRPLNGFDARDAARRDQELLLEGNDPLSFDKVRRAPRSCGALHARLDGSPRRARRVLVKGAVMQQSAVARTGATVAARAAWTVPTAAIRSAIGRAGDRRPKGQSAIPRERSVRIRPSAHRSRRRRPQGIPAARCSGTDRPPCPRPAGSG